MSKTPAQLRDVTKAALRAHDLGLVVVPTPPGEKGPRKRNWGLDRPTRTYLEAYFETHDDGFGLLLGAAGGIMALDLDGPNAEAELKSSYGDLPDTLEVPTKRGRQLFFKYDRRFAEVASVFKVGEIEHRLGNGKAAQSLVWSDGVDYGGDRDYPRRLIFRPIASLPETAIARIIAQAPKAAPKTSEPDDFIAEVADVSRVLRALGSLKPSRRDNYDEWFRVLCALKSAGEWALPLADAWSRPSPKYGDVAKTWQRIRPGGITLGSLYFWAEEDTKAATVAQGEPATSFTGAQLLSQPDPPINPVVADFIARGDVTAVIAKTKLGKSWWVLQLACSIASGKPFLGMETIRGRVRLFDNELRIDTIRRRLRVVSQAMRMTDADLANLEIVPLKGKHRTYDDIKAELASLKTDYQLVVLDASYKFLARGVDENSNSDMAAQYAILDAIAEESGCAVLIVHHASKGSQRGKANVDVGSGAGAQARSVDNHATITAHPDAPGIFVLAADVRNFAPFRPVCIEHKHPLWQIAPGFTADGKSPSTLEDFLETIPTDPAPKKETLKSSHAVLGDSWKDILALLQVATTDGLVAITVPVKKTDAHLIHRTNEGTAMLNRSRHTQPL